MEGVNIVCSVFFDNRGDARPQSGQDGSDDYYNDDAYNNHKYRQGTAKLVRTQRAQGHQYGFGRDESIQFEFHRSVLRHRHDGIETRCLPRRIDAGYYSNSPGYK